MAPVVHIGYHKTATTWFQKRLYPRVSGYALVTRKRVQEILLAPAAFGFDPERARRLLGLDGEGPTPILCEEELSGNPHSAGMRGCFSKDVAERIRRTLPDARIVIFVRNQVHMCAALYQHYVREGGNYGPSRYLFPERHRRDVARHGFKYPLFSIDYLDYLGLVEHYRALFGPEQVQVFAFESFRADPQSFARDFAAGLGLEVDTDALDYSPENRGFGRNALWCGRLLNYLTYRSVLDKRFCLTLVSNKVRSDLPRWLNRTSLRGPDQSPPDVLGRRLVAEIESRFAAPNRALAAVTGLPLGELGYPWAGDGDPQPDRQVRRPG